MNIFIDKETGKITVAAEEVARFARTKKSAPLRIPFIDADEEYNDPTEIRRQLSYTVTKGTESLTVFGLCDH